MFGLVFSGNNTDEWARGRSNEGNVWTYESGSNTKLEKNYIEDLHYIHSRHSIFRISKYRWITSGHETHAGHEKCIRNFDLKPEGKIPPVRPGRRLEDNIKVDLIQIVCKGGD